MPERHLSRAGHEKSRLNYRDHPERLNTTERPIANQYREGKVKSTSDRGVKKTLKPCAYKRSEPLCVVTACLCIMNLRVAVGGEAIGLQVRSRSESESEQGVKSPEADAKPSDLRMGRMKTW